MLSALAKRHFLNFSQDKKRTVTILSREDELPVLVEGSFGDGVEVDGDALTVGPMGDLMQSLNGVHSGRPTILARSGVDLEDRGQVPLKYPPC